MKISIYPPLFIHEIGQRPNQEDSIAQWDNRLFVLCDGMGGHEKGEVASQTICQSLVRWFEQNIKEVSFTDDQLRDALEYAYTELDKYDDGNPRKMGTTLTLLFIHAQGITAAHIGDSRIYHIRPSMHNEGILYQSRDHSLVFDLFQAGEISYDEMATFPQKNIVTRAMTPGLDNRMKPDIIHITDILSDDYFFLCSDGMLEQMDRDNQLLLALFVSHAPDTLKRDQFISETLNNQDNHSAWIIHIKDIICEKSDERLVNEEPTARCNAINIIPHVVAEDDNDVVIINENPKRLSFYKWIKNLFSIIKNSYSNNMKKEDVVIGGLYFVKDNPSLFEIKTDLDNCCQVEGILYNGNVKSEKTVMSVSELAPITITEEMLHLLSFTEIDGNLEGLPNEHFFELKTDWETIRMIKEKGQFCYVQRMANAFHGCKFVGMPYLHQLQALLAPICPIDIHIIIKHYATPTT